MSRCYCRAVLAVLVIIFAWLSGTWVSIVLTVLGFLLAVGSLSGTCCCAVRREQKEQNQASPGD
jgi:hypothetical protein